MKAIFAAASLILVLIFSASVSAAEQTVTLRVENMFCASCPYIVRQALARVPGVTDVKVSYDAASAIAVATVDYEDSKADTATLMAATGDVGFPSGLAR